ncbi:Oidioi.mRNA.OKI2018_I69.chr2.g5483.t1.cds [Oikopleura dioica]|uniref:Oidioi.mRNA.OKI2018_I69.chr2.g5483.t1.cds n=1 Tax=Oikopleura dioica TaxID=34765 RepID=A0ABN7T720_OIKDI|nr:Oidioi.mRNA.OKI2018_I69.chr2.g5483.t1.cds [Oikopleura dioica]
MEHISNAEKMREMTSIEYWILPLVCASHLKEINWLHPPWADQLEDGRRELSVGFAEGIIEKGKTRLAVSWSWDYFTSDATYCAEENCQFIQNFQISFLDLIWSPLERLFLRVDAVIIEESKESRYVRKAARRAAPIELHEEFQKRRAKKLHCSEGNDGLLIYNAGRTSQDDRPALPVHIPTDQEVEQMIKRFGAKVRSVFADLGLPAEIRLARSTKDGFCPEAVGQFANFLTKMQFQNFEIQSLNLSFLRTQIVESIQSSVIAVLKEIFKEFSLLLNYL